MGSGDGDAERGDVRLRAPQSCHEARSLRGHESLRTEGVDARPFLEIDGQVMDRKKGERVGALGSEWREARRQNSALFYKSRIGEEAAWRQGRVRVWFQPKATEDTIIVSFLSDLIVEDTR